MLPCAKMQPLLVSPTVFAVLLLLRHGKVPLISRPLNPDLGPWSRKCQKSSLIQGHEGEEENGTDFR